MLLGYAKSIDAQFNACVFMLCGDNAVVCAAAARKPKVSFNSVSSFFICF